MNQGHLQQIIDHYIERFDELNGPGHWEYYKWCVIQRFRPMLDEALAAPDDAFPAKLYAIKKFTANLIDNYTQPLNGLVEFAKKDPEAVRAMFTRLLHAAEADVNTKQTAIRAFLNDSHQLREKYFPGSYLYSDDLHSVTGYLFLYEPDHNYLYKATHCRAFADCVEFYDDWGSGETTRLDVFFRMCDEVLPLLKENEPLMKAAASRYDIAPGKMHPDTEKHILLFDLIYCCSTYGLFHGIKFVVPKSGERRLIQERKDKAQALSDALDKARGELDQLNEVTAFLKNVFEPGTTLRHRSFGEGEIVQAKETSATILFPKVGQKSLAIVDSVANGLITFDDAQVQQKLEGYRDVLRRSALIRNTVNHLENELIQYTDYLD